MIVQASRCGTPVRNIRRHAANTVVYSYEAMDRNGVWYKLDTATQDSVLHRPPALPGGQELEELLARQDTAANVLAVFGYRYQLIEGQKDAFPVAGHNLSWPDAVAAARHKLLTHYPVYSAAVVYHAGFGSPLLRMEFDGELLRTFEAVDLGAYLSEHPKEDQ
jgi:hypothetical protein